MWPQTRVVKPKLVVMFECSNVLKNIYPPGKFRFFGRKPAKRAERTSLSEFFSDTHNFFGSFCEHYPTSSLKSWGYNVPLMFGAEMAKEQSNKINDLAAFICSRFSGGQNITKPTPFFRTKWLPRGFHTFGLGLSDWGV